MDFSTVSKLVEANGYTKVHTQSSLVTYNTIFIKEDNKISINWALGGYISSVIVGDFSGSKIVYDSAQEFIEAFS